MKKSVSVSRQIGKDEEEQDSPSHIFGSILGQESKYGNDASDVAEADLPCAADGPPMVATEVHVEPADDDGHGAVGAHGDKEEGGWK